MGLRVNPTSWMIHFAICLHLIWGVLLLFSPHPANVTAVHSMSIENHVFLGASLLIVALMAWVGTLDVFNGTKTGLILLLPQQFVLMASAYGAIIAITNSTFADGVVRPREFIGADQAPAILTAIMHTFAIIDFHFGKWLRKPLS